MSAALPPTVKHAIAVGRMSKGRVVKGIEQMWCRASKSARGDGKFAATMWRLLSSTPVLGIALQPLYLLASPRPRRDPVDLFHINNGKSGKEII